MHTSLPLPFTFLYEVLHGFCDLMGWRRRRGALRPPSRTPDSESVLVFFLWKKCTSCYVVVTTIMLKVPYGKKGAIPLTTYVAIRRWVDVVRGRRLPHVRDAGMSSSLRPAVTVRRRHAKQTALIGHGVHVDGVSNRMTSKPTSQNEWVVGGILARDSCYCKSVRVSVCHTGGSAENGWS